MAAIHNVLSLLRTGDHVVSTQDLYGGAWRIFTKYFAKFGIDFTFVDTSDLGAVENAVRPETRLLWLETPSNPLLKTSDIAACSAIARRAGIRTVVDNTFATPVLQQPISLGADIVLHSTTKYINGHSDALGGAVITDDESLFTELKFFQNAIGAVPGPQDCFLILRGVKTLGLRMARHCENAGEWSTICARTTASHASTIPNSAPSSRSSSMPTMERFRRPSRSASASGYGRWPRASAA